MTTPNLKTILKNKTIISPHGSNATIEWGCTNSPPWRTTSPRIAQTFPSRITFGNQLHPLTNQFAAKTIF